MLKHTAQYLPFFTWPYDVLVMSPYDAIDPHVHCNLFGGSRPLLGHVGCFHQEVDKDKVFLVD